MNTKVSVLAPADPRFDKAVSVVAATFERVEACLSRFRAESELCTLNRSAGTPFPASPLLMQAISLALKAAQATDGTFDPTVLPALEAAGYDRSFEQISGGTAVAVVPPVTTDYRSIRLDSVASTITLQAGQRVDLGGIGKGLAVDLALEATEFLTHRCINAGGDIAVRGEAWSVELEDAGERPPIIISLTDSALGTSTITRRHWKQAGVEQHHLIDLHTRKPSTSPFRTVSVVARSCVEADVAAKTALLLGEDGLAFLEGHGLHGFAVRRDGTVTGTSLWPWS